MNTAVNIIFKSFTSTKEYTLKIFKTGKIVIAGVTSPFEQSELNVIVSMLIGAILKFNSNFEIP